MPDKNSDIEKAEEARCSALRAADTAALERLLADNFLYVHASGRTEDKQAYINAIGGRTFSLQDFSRSGVSVNRAGDCAVMSGLISVTRAEAGNTKVTPFSFVGVWTKAGDGWRLLFWKHSKT